MNQDKINDLVLKIGDLFDQEKVTPAEAYAAMTFIIGTFDLENSEIRKVHDQ